MEQKYALAGRRVQEHVFLLLKWAALGRRKWTSLFKERTVKQRSEKEEYPSMSAFTVSEEWVKAF